MYVYLYVYLYESLEEDSFLGPQRSSLFPNTLPHYHRFSQTELLGFIFPTTIFDNRFVNDSGENETIVRDTEYMYPPPHMTHDVHVSSFVNDSGENETKKFGLASLW